MNDKLKVAGIGELLWDVLPSGKQAGGAPFNFAFHACQEGCESYIFSAIVRVSPGQPFPVPNVYKYKLLE